MGRPRLWTPAKHTALMNSQTEPPATPSPPPGYVPVTDRSPMGYTRRDAKQAALRLSGEIAGLQCLAAELSADADAERTVDALQRIIASASIALAHAARLRGIQETAANFEETP